MCVRIGRCGKLGSLDYWAEGTRSGACNPLLCSHGNVVHVLNYLAELTSILGYAFLPVLGAASVSIAVQPHSTNISVGEQPSNYCWLSTCHLSSRSKSQVMSAKENWRLHWQWCIYKHRPKTRHHRINSALFQKNIQQAKMSASSPRSPLLWNKGNSLNVWPTMFLFMWC